MISIDEQITEIELLILGGEEWLRRARIKEIKRSPEQIERRQQRLNVQRAILETLRMAARAIGGK